MKKKMRKKFVVLILLFSFFLTSAVFAQDTVDPQTVDLQEVDLDNLWLGGSLGAPGVNFHVGFNDLLSDNIDLRGNLGYSYLFSPGFYVGADALFDINLDTDELPVDAYLGAGAFASFGSSFGLGLNGLFGGEYRLGELGLPQGGIFLELGPDLYLKPITSVGFTGRFGFNYHF